ncbi:MAG: HAD family phosphatase [Lachnospiraceae bacterium]|jgi:putative hydrolase of the HAD superfamily|nr:HAD family phosphatase [Lachnospiraceae bacterium]
MIKNIVFDMGKVLVGYDAMRVCEHYIEDEHDRKRVHTAVFVSPEWVMMDMGLLTDNQALLSICKRLPERLHDVAALCLRDWHKYCMWTYTEMEPVIRKLKEKGFGIYLCSNAAIRLLDCYKEVIPAVDCFDGLLFSAEVKCMKPQREMYQHLFNRFHIKPEECFFIDDMPANIDGACACGMNGYCFADGDMQRLWKVLERME